MRWIFDIENPVMQYVIKVFDCMCLSVLWLLFSLPVITAGASATALYAAVYHYIRRDEGHMLRTFWGAFRENLKRSTVVWLAAGVVLRTGCPGVPGLLLVLPLRGEALAMEADVRELRRLRR